MKEKVVDEKDVLKEKKINYVYEKLLKNFWKNTLVILCLSNNKK